MQKTSKKVMNRRVDADIIAQLDTATTSISAAVASLSYVQQAKTTLGENEVAVEEEDNMFAVVSDGWMGYLEQIAQFSSADYVDIKYLDGPVMRVKRWAGVNWVRHHNLTGAGTASEKCYMFHRDAIGSAFDTSEGFNVAVGYDEEQDYSYARCSAFTGAKLLQQSGIVQMLHDASGI